MPTYNELNAVTEENPIEVSTQGVTYSVCVDMIYGRGAPYESHFINFNIRGVEEPNVIAKRGHPLRHSKFHVSLPESNKDTVDADFSKGFEIIVNILAKYRVRHFKVVRPGIKLSEQVDSQRGKEFTIYCKDNPEFTVQNWQRIAQEITQELTHAGVQPGYPAVTLAPGQKITWETMYLLDRAGYPVSGSNYMTYRIESGKDYFQRIRVDVPNQPQPVEWVPSKPQPDDTRDAPSLGKPPT